MPIDWKPIETCPFREWLEIWISDGESVMLASVTKRLGYGMPLTIVAGEHEWPEWRHEWRLVNEDEPDSDYGKPEVDIRYAPTHWAEVAGRPPCP